MKVVSVSFHGNNLEVFANGNQWVNLKPICEAIELSISSQYQKLKADESFEAKLIKVRTKGGMQDVFCIPLSKLNGWLFSINPNKVKPEVRQKLIDYKNECFDVLYQHFNQKADTHQLERENVELKRALNRLLKQPTPTCEELLKLHYPVLHNNILELNSTFKNIDIAALSRFVFFISQIQKNVANLAKGLKEDRKKRSNNV